MLNHEIIIQTHRTINLSITFRSKPAFPNNPYIIFCGVLHKRISTVPNPKLFFHTDIGINEDRDS